MAAGPSVEVQTGAGPVAVHQAAVLEVVHQVGVEKVAGQDTAAAADVAHLTWVAPGNVAGSDSVPVAALAEEGLASLEVDPVLAEVPDLAADLEADARVGTVQTADRLQDSAIPVELEDQDGTVAAGMTAAPRNQRYSLVEGQIRHRKLPSSADIGRRIEAGAGVVAEEVLDAVAAGVLAEAGSTVVRAKDLKEVHPVSAAAEDAAAVAVVVQGIVGVVHQDAEVAADEVGPGRVELEPDTSSVVAADAEIARVVGLQLMVELQKFSLLWWPHH